MEPVYSEWRECVDANNHFETTYCPYCSERTARMMVRYVTNRDGESERQYRVQCPICLNIGKTYAHKSIAEKSWEVRENNPPVEPKPRRRSYW